MRIFRKNSETVIVKRISLIINKIKFIDMCKITKSNPVLQRNGVANNLYTYYQIVVKLA